MFYIFRGSRVHFSLRFIPTFLETAVYFQRLCPLGLAKLGQSHNSYVWFYDNQIKSAQATS